MSKMSVNINTTIQQFMSNGCGYIRSDVEMDSYKPWRAPDHMKDVELERDVAFINKLTDMYDKIGPKEWVSRTVHSYVPIDAEVGDDHLYLGDAPLCFVAELVTAQDTFGIEVSMKDTFISSRYANYSESFILKPDNIAELNQPNLKPGEDVVVFDIAKVRTVLPVCSMRQKHSDTVDGKVSLLGKQALYKTELCGYEVKIAQCVQQICLGLMKERKFPYAPTFLGGYGSPPIFDNVHSMIRCFETYRSGSYYNVLAGICLAVHEVKLNGRSASKAFLSTVKGHAEAWQDWYKVYTKYTPSIRGNLDPLLYGEHYLGTLGKDEIWDSAANRLLSAGAVVSKTQLLVHDHMETLSTVLLSAENSLEVREKIENEKRVQRQDSVFNPKLLQEVNFDLPLRLEDELVESLLDLSRSANYHLKALLSADEIFSRDALDQIKQKGPTKVNIQMQTAKGHRLPLQFDLHIKEDEVEYYESLYDFVKGEKDLNDVSRVLIEDDPVLLQIAKEWAISSSMKPLSSLNVMVITTDDVALCKNINRVVPQIVVIRIAARKRSPESIQSIKDSLKATYKFADLRFYDDEGSLAHARASTARLYVPRKGWQRVKFSLARVINPDKTDHRRLNAVRVVDLVIKPDDLFDQQGLLSHRYNVPRVSFKRTLTRHGIEEEYAFERPSG